MFLLFEIRKIKQKLKLRSGKIKVNFDSVQHVIAKRNADVDI